MLSKKINPDARIFQEGNREASEVEVSLGYLKRTDSEIPAPAKQGEVVNSVGGVPSGSGQFIHFRFHLCQFSKGVIRHTYHIMDFFWLCKWNVKPKQTNKISRVPHQPKIHEMWSFLPSAQHTGMFGEIDGFRCK
jgi:hypothetical protein